MADLGQQTVEFSAVVRRAAEESFLSLKELVEKSPNQNDSEKKIRLLKYILNTRQRMLRLHVLAKWCRQNPLVQYCQQLSGTLSSHDTCFSQAADSLFFSHEGLQQARAPIYDVPSAIEILQTGTYKRLPKCIEDMGLLSLLSEDERKEAFEKLNPLMWSRLLEVVDQKEFSHVDVSEGTARFSVDGEFRVQLTLGYRGHLSMWRILHLELLVGEKNGPVKLEEMRRHALGEELERRMAAAEKPFVILKSVLHEFCIALVVDTVIRQLKTLQQGRWKDAIRFEVIADGSAGQGVHTQLPQDGDSDPSSSRTPGIKLMYWLEGDKNMGGSDLGSVPFIKIERGPDQQITCSHSTFIIDPLTGNEAELSLDLSCIDVEKLLLRVIACNRHTRLLEVHRELRSNSQICQAAGDVVLRCHILDKSEAASGKESFFGGFDGQWEEALSVRAFSTSYISLGINIRNGRFLFQSSRNVVVPSALAECEEALNQGTMTAAEVFISLRNKSLLHLFSSIGRFFGLKVYDQDSTALKIPKELMNGSDLLLMGFPQCGNSYYLLMQLDRDFKPLFTLLESEADPNGKSSLLGDANHVIRINKIDIGEMQMVEDEVNLSVLDLKKLLSPLKESGSANQILESGLHSSLNNDASVQFPGCPQSCFSSLADDVFDFEKAASLPQHLSVNNHVPLLVDSAPLSHLSSPQTSHQRITAGFISPRWEANSQFSQNSKISKVTISGPQFSNNPSFSSHSSKGLLETCPNNSLSPFGTVRSPSMQRLSISKSDQDLTSLKSVPHPVQVSSASGIDESSEEAHVMVSGNRPTHPLRTNDPRVLSSSSRTGLLRSSPTRHIGCPLRNPMSSVWATSPVCQTSETGIPDSMSDAVKKPEKTQRKRSLSDIIKLVPSLQEIEATTAMRKRRKMSESEIVPFRIAEASTLPASICKTRVLTYGDILDEANHGLAPSSIYATVLLHVVRHCSLCIKHARLTSQMDALDIPYVEEVGLRKPSSNLWFRLPRSGNDSWQHICLRLGRPGSMYWDVKVSDQHFRDLWELQRESNNTQWGPGVRIANTSDVDSHIRYDPDGVVLSYRTVEVNSIVKLVADLQRLSNALTFALGMRKLLGARAEDGPHESRGSNESRAVVGAKSVGEVGDKVAEQMRKTFRIEAVGLMSLWFSYLGSMPGIMARFVVEWEAGKEGCTMHISPDQLWPHSKFLEDFINGGEVASLLDCIRLTAGPLLALAGAIRPARMSGPGSAMPNITMGGSVQAGNKPNTFVASQGQVQSNNTSHPHQNPLNITTGNATALGPIGNHITQSAAMLSVAGRGGPGIVPSTLLPIDVSVVLRSPYWIRIIYRKNFAVDMRCFAGDHVWLQPATPPKGGPEAGGSLPCPQFRPFIMEHVAQGLNTLDANLIGGAASSTSVNSSSGNPTLTSITSQAPPPTTGARPNPASSAGIPRAIGPSGAVLNRVNPNLVGPSGSGAVNPGLPMRISPGSGLPVHVRGELNTAFIGLGDDGGYGGGWVPLAALKKVLRGILKYLGVLWLFAQLPNLLKDILGSILKDNEGALLNLDQEQPALRFFVGGYVFAVSVHRVQLLLQVLSVKRFHQQPQQQQQQQPNQNQTVSTQEELTQSEIAEICDYFSRRVASEPYDASRVASFITLLTLPIPVLREFLKLIAWKKGLLSQAQGQQQPGGGAGGEAAGPTQRPRVELCLENHGSWSPEEVPGSNEKPLNSRLGTSKSNIRYNRLNNSVDFGLTIVLDPTHIPHVNAAGGAAWLPHCVLVRLRYSFGESNHVTLIGVEGSHGGRACWPRVEDWDRCRQRVVRAVDLYGSGAAPPGADLSQGRLRMVAETLQRALLASLQQPRDGGS
ncbi:mediator of RNA polymerase II transcription subunit 14 isoform X2 [Amborella trichopoda]|uniref:Mediator of RNA polymerase II transcription subunit 14 n=1 Tax=Amborella trichopoda TaxID=13333 RepID=W1P3A6_AMBTC|nr:mediator of RNA polymerase II transcription subunit 14 isoform X2 [Amborella trichopoda]ERN01440.1 hypothetical protein AMTR_s00002p00266990 [Amborella trichopoda]|eukprot:XP_006838871.1 mediator of RNA polymerase II transcription subunit 14 isoform X2 [Amborella trichopoda]